jgi:hypothetical protein
LAANIYEERSLVTKPSNGLFLRLDFRTHRLILSPLPSSFLRRWKPTLVHDQAAQIFDLTGVAGVAPS